MIVMARTGKYEDAAREAGAALNSFTALGVTAYASRAALLHGEVTARLGTPACTAGAAAGA